MPASAATTQERGPRLLRHRSIRFRLTLLYGALFLVAGGLLLALTYVLATHSPLSSGPPRPSHPMVDRPGGGPGLPPPDVEDPWFVDQVGEELHRQRDDDVRGLMVSSLVAFGAMGAVSMLLGWVVAGRILRPLDRMTTTVRHISAESLHTRLRAGGPEDEIKRLADTFDQLLDRLEAAFDSQRQFVANASHELRTPLTFQRALVEVALADPDAPADVLRRTCEQVVETSEEQEQLIDALLVLARSRRGLDRREDLDLAGLTGEAVQGREHQTEEVGLRLSAALEPARMAGDPALVERLVANLLDNALRHNTPGGWIEVSTSTNANGAAALRVVNSGPEIRGDQVDGLFEPFQRGEGARTGREGHGLGLSIVAAVAAAHSGNVDARPGPRGGLDITVTFPTRPE